MSERHDPTRGLSEEELLEATRFNAERDHYSLYLAASAALHSHFPKGVLAIVDPLHQVEVRYGNRDRQNVTFKPGNRAGVNAFLRGMIAMSHDSLEVLA